MVRLEELGLAAIERVSVVEASSRKTGLVPILMRPIAVSTFSQPGKIRPNRSNSSSEPLSKVVGICTFVHTSPMAAQCRRECPDTTGVDHELCRRDSARV